MARRALQVVVLGAVLLGSVTTRAEAEPIALGASAIAAPGPVLSYRGAGPVLVGPTRILDSSSGLGLSGPVGAGQVVTVQVAGRGGVPTAGAGSVLLSVTASAPAAATALTIWATGEPRPVTGTSLSAPAGQASTSAVLTKLGPGGRVNVFNTASAVPLKIDVTGWIPETAAVQPLAPVRLLDTAASAGSPVGPGATVRVRVAGHGGVPVSGAATVAVTVTVVAPTVATSVQAYGSGGPVAAVPVVQAPAGRTFSAFAVLPLGSDGALVLRNAAGKAHLRLDVSGWLPAGPALTTLAPSLLLDTSTGVGAPEGPLAAGGTVDVPVLGRGGLPGRGVGSVLLAVTAKGATKPTTVTAYATGSAVPNATSLSTGPGVATTTAVLAKVGTGGKVRLRNQSGTVQLTASVTAWTPEGDELVTIQPKAGTRLAGPGDVVSVRGNEVLLSPSADVPPVGGYLSSSPGPDGSGAALGKVLSLTRKAGAKTLVVLDVDVQAYDAFADLQLSHHGPARAAAASPAPGQPTATAGTSFLSGFGFGLIDFAGLSCSGGVDPHALLTDVRLGLQDLSVDFDYDLSERYLLFRMSGTGVFTATLSQPVTASCGGSVDLPVLIPLGPVVVTAQASLTVSITTDPGTASDQTTFSATAPVTIGLRTKGGDGSNLSSASFSGSAGGATGVSLTFTAGLTVGIGWRIVEGTATFAMSLTIGPDPEHYGPRCIDVDLTPTISLGATVDAFFKDVDITFVTFEGQKANLYNGPCISWKGTVDLSYKGRGVYDDGRYSWNFDSRAVLTFDGTTPARLYNGEVVAQPYTWTAHDRDVLAVSCGPQGGVDTARDDYSGSGASQPDHDLVLWFRQNTADPYYITDIGPLPGSTTDSGCGQSQTNPGQSSYRQGGPALPGPFNAYSRSVQGTAVLTPDSTQPGIKNTTVMNLTAVEVVG